MSEFGGLLFLVAIFGGLWLAWRNLRDALRNPRSREGAQGALLGALLGWWLAGRGYFTPPRLG
jgi:hypothetical protein